MKESVLPGKGNKSRTGSRERSQKRKSERSASGSGPTLQNESKDPQRNRLLEPGNGRDLESAEMPNPFESGA